MLPLAVPIVAFGVSFGALARATGMGWLEPVLMFLEDPQALGLDAAFPAIFLALLAPQLSGRRARWAALGGVAIALALTPFAPVGVPIIAASAGALVGWRAER